MNTSTLASHEFDSQRIAAELIRRGLPVDYSQRAAAEFTDHHGDLVKQLHAEGMDDCTAELEATRRLGEPRTLVKKTVREYQRRFWCGRWPMLTFLIAPIPLMILAWIASILVVSTVAGVLEWLNLIGPYEWDGKITTIEWFLDRAVVVWFLLVIPASVVLVFTQIARRAALGWRWIALAACLLAITAGSIRSGFPQPVHKTTRFDGTALPADSHIITLALPFYAPATATPQMIVKSLWDWFTRDATQAGQLLLPLLIAMAGMYRARQLSQQAEKLVFDDC